MITLPDPPLDSFLVDCKSPDLQEQVYSPGYRYRSWQGLFVFFLLLQLLQLYTVAAWVDRSGVCELRRVSYRRGVRARRADFSPFQVDRLTKCKRHIPIGLLVRGISRSDCLVSKASDFAVKAKFHCIYVASNRWHRGSTPPHNPEGRQFEPSWGRRWRSSR